MFCWWNFPKCEVTNNKLIQTGLIYAGVLMLAAYIFGLFVDLTGDASKYGAIARNIIDSGDLINLKIHGEPYEHKPALLFWLAALGLKIGGIHNWTFKLFPVLYSFAGLYFTFKLGEILYNRKIGILAAVLLSSSWIYFFFTADIHTDLILQANTTLAIWQLAAYLKTKKSSHFLWAFIGVGLAMLSKGLVGAAIPAFALCAHLLFTKNFNQLYHPKWLLGIAIALVFTFPTLWGIYNQFGLAGIKFFLFTNNIGRITGTYNGSNTDFLYYLHTLAYLLIPWTFLFVFAFGHEIKSYFQSRPTKREFFTVGAILIYLIIISLSKSKAPHYIFMIVPLITIVMAHWLHEKLADPNSRSAKWLLKIQAIMPFFLTALILLILVYLFPSQNIMLWLIVVCSVILSLAFQFIQISTEHRFFLPSVIMMMSFVLVMNTHTLKEISNYQASTRASRYYNEKSSDKEKLYDYLFPFYEVYFYARSGAEKIYTIKDFKPDDELTSWVFTTEEGKDSLLQVYPEWITKIDTFPHQGMSRLRPRFYNPKTRESALEKTYLIQLKKQ